MASFRGEWLELIVRIRSSVHLAGSLLPRLTAIEQSAFELALAELDQARRRAEASDLTVGGPRIAEVFAMAKAALANLEYAVRSAQAGAVQIHAVRSAAAAISSLVDEIDDDDGFGGPRME